MVDVFGVKCIILTVSMCCTQRFIWRLTHCHPNTHPHTFHIFNKQLSDPYFRCSILHYTRVLSQFGGFNQHWANSFVEFKVTLSLFSFLRCLSSPHPHTRGSDSFSSGWVWVWADKDGSRPRPAYVPFWIPTRPTSISYLWYYWYSLHPSSTHLNTAFFSLCTLIHDSLLPSCLQRSAVAIQEVPSMAARWATVSTWTMWSASFAIRATKWRGPHMLTARQTASGATRLQHVKVGKKVKCITPNFTYVKP